LAQEMIISEMLKMKRVYEHLRRDHGAHIFNVEELDDCLSQTGFKNFEHNIYGSMILFHAEKA